MSESRESQFLNPDAPYQGGHLLHNLTLFARLCRGLGMDVSPHTVREAAGALRYVHLGRKGDVFNVLRSLMVSRREHLAPFQEAFRRFWRTRDEQWSRLDLRSLGEERPEKRLRMLPAGSQEDSQDSDSPQPQHDEEQQLALLPLPSEQEVLRRKDFADMSAEELEMARRLLAGLDLKRLLRRSRRLRPGRGHRLDVRRLLRQSLRHLGEPLHLPTRLPKLKPRRLVLLCDISGSMESYTRLLLHFMHVLQSAGGPPIESFVFATRLSRITLSLRHKSVDRALSEVGHQVRDWGGGTRIGAALRSFNFDFSRRLLGQGAVVLLISDGWDRGEPEILAREAARLSRSCRRLIWLNPLLGRPRYEPLTRGAQALLPHVDDFLPVHNLDSLQKLARILTRLSAEGR
ncbi:MAG TPA: VWA domain-containing protein [Acidobacteriota bacterium]|nr:VWA domain-containing protein [Acidobacteriota bacterium]